MNDNREWFSAKRFGYGAGLPIAWQGWVLLGLYGAIVTLGALLLAPISLVAFISLTLMLTAVFVWITARTTRGGFAWRWNSKE